jgi:NitT/TauT family transport system substrate-binding protein
MLSCCAAALIIAAFLGGLIAAPACAADRLRIAVQKTGTLAWEMSVIRAQGLDKEADLDLQIVDVASLDAAIIALRSGAADMIVTDWLWVSRERSLGANFVFYPYSSAIGAVVANPAKGVARLHDLIGRKLAVAGGPLDKSWLLLQAWTRRAGLDLGRAANIVYGAPKRRHRAKSTPRSNIGISAPISKRRVSPGSSKLPMSRGRSAQPGR